ncbi:AAA family ATPase [Actinophytocola oryzae]|uniref:AAA family ATPase n=1 Tax=Actinophytocola oryzae TaxID=502181 RepID=UPI001414E088|nr:AAA family ATPase [Actinophytocola oryzae]
MTDVEDVDDAVAADWLSSVRFLSLSLTNYLSYRSAKLDFGDFTALVGPNGSGKSNAVSALKLLRDIPLHGLPAAIARRGGFDQLRHRSSGRPYDPAIRIDYQVGDNPPSFYELRLGSVKGKRYAVKRERGAVYVSGDQSYFDHEGGTLTYTEVIGGDDKLLSMREAHARVPPGQSAVTLSGGFAAYLTGIVLQSAQTLEINPSRISDLQEPASVREFEPDGANIASVFEEMSAHNRSELAELLSVIVPGIVRIEPRHVADRLTMLFVQDLGQGPREFFAKQMSDGTLRVFGILVAMLQQRRPAMLAIEEPEIAIHLGALQTLVEVLTSHSEGSQIVITTHSADIVDNLDMDDLRVVWTEQGSSRIASVAEHTREPVKRGLITPGALLRADALDPSA